MSEQIQLNFNIPWTYAECAHFLRITETTLRDRVKRGRSHPPITKLGDEDQDPVRFWPPFVVEWLSERTSGRPVKRGRPRKATAPALPR